MSSCPASADDRASSTRNAIAPQVRPSFTSTPHHPAPQREMSSTRLRFWATQRPASSGGAAGTDWASAMPATQNAATIAAANGTARMSDLPCSTTAVDGCRPWPRWFSHSLYASWCCPRRCWPSRSGPDGGRCPTSSFVVLQRLPWVFPLHMIASGLALILIPIAAFARPWRGVHRAAGRMAAAAVIIGGLTALPVALASEADGAVARRLVHARRGLARAAGGRRDGDPPRRGRASRALHDRDGGGRLRGHLAAPGHVRRQSGRRAVRRRLRGRGLGLLARSARARRDRAQHRTRAVPAPRGA